MNERESILREIARLAEELAHQRARLNRVEGVLLEVLLILEKLGHHHPHRSPPSAGKLTGSNHPSGASMSTTVLNASISSTRQDGSALAPTDIGSITYQKTSLTGSPPVAGPLTALQTNSANSGAGLLPTDLTFTDSTALPGDDYTVFFTDTQGHIGAPSNDFTNPAQASPPSAGTLSGTFNP